MTEQATTDSTKTDSTNTDQITIDIVSDTVCPWCFVGKRRLESALARLPDDVEVLIAWRPFQLNPDLPPEGADRRTHLERKFGGKERAQQVYDTIGNAGQSVGISFDFKQIGRQPNTVDSHRLIDRAGRLGKQDAVVEALFKAYFLDGRDIGDHETLAEIAESAGLDRAETRAYLDSDEDIERIRSEDAMARRMGVSGVPCFILNRKYAVSGAQEPDVLLEAFETVRREAAEVGTETEPAARG